MSDKLIINKKTFKGDDGYKVFSIRVKDELAKSLATIAEETHRSRNELINILLEFAINNCEIE